MFDYASIPHAFKRQYPLHVMQKHPALKQLPNSFFDGRHVLFPISHFCLYWRMSHDHVYFLQNTVPGALLPKHEPKIIRMCTLQPLYKLDIVILPLGTCFECARCSTCLKKKFTPQYILRHHNGTINLDLAL